MFLPIPRDAPLLPPNSVPTQTLICGFAGNPDIYGPGIRIGLYAQMLAVWFANYFLLSQLPILRDTVSIFAFAILIVSIIFASDPSSVHAIEVFLLLQILSWSCLMGVRAKSSYTSAQSSSTVVRSMVNASIQLAGLGLHVWFWWGGVDSMERGGKGCGTWIMYVIRTDLFGWARKIMMGLSVFVLWCQVYADFVQVLRGWVWWRTAGVRVEFAEAVRMWEGMQKECATTEDADLKAERNQGGTEEVVDEDMSHDGCSALEGFRCSTEQSRSVLNREATLVPSSITPTADAMDLAQQPSLEHRISSEASSSQAGASQTRPISPGLCILIQTYESEQFIKHCISASPYQAANNGKPLTPLSFLRYIRSTRKHPPTNSDEEEEHTTTPSSPNTWISSHIAVAKALFTLRTPPRTMLLYSHLTRSNTLDPLNGPFQCHASLSYTSPLPSWPIISLASSLLLYSPTVPKKIWLAWYYAFIDLSVHVLVITQLELTLRWNNVSGLTNLWGSVGQLIPFIIGVGGLVLVGGRWAREKWAKSKKGSLRMAEILELETVEDFDISGVGKRVREGWEKWKEAKMKDNAVASCTGSVEGAVCPGGSLNRHD